MSAPKCESWYEDDDSFLGCEAGVVMTQRRPHWDDNLIEAVGAE